MHEVLCTSTGNELLHDEAAWTALGQRLGVDWATATDDDRFPFPDNLRFSADGQFVAYVVRIGCPVTGAWPDAFNRATVVENMRTGRRVATLPAVTDTLTIAPGGRAAVWSMAPSNDAGLVVKASLWKRLWNGEEGRSFEQPQFVLWDLETSAVRAHLWTPKDFFGHPEYTADGRFVLSSFGGTIRCWDATTGRVVGEATAGPTGHYLDGGRILVTRSTSSDVIYFIDITTGKPFPDFELSPPANGTGSIGPLDSTGGDRYVALHFHPEKGPQSPSGFPFLDRMAERLPDFGSEKDRSKVLVVDVIERREVGKFPGQSAAFSEDGRWLATIDAEGVVRVWKMPFGRPWGRGALYAVLLVYGSWSMLKVIGRLRGRLGKKQTGEPLSPIQSTVQVAKA